MVAAELPVIVANASAKSVAVAETAGDEGVQPFAELLASTEAQSLSGPSDLPLIDSAEAIEATADDIAAAEIALATGDPAIIAAMVQTLDRLAAAQSPAVADATQAGANATAGNAQLIGQVIAARAPRSAAAGFVARGAEPDAAARDSKLLQAVLGGGVEVAREHSPLNVATTLERRENGSGADSQDSQNLTSVVVAEAAQSKNGTELARHAANLHERMGSGAWRDELGAKLTWMVDRGVQSGSLRLTPEHLGPLEVRISVQSDQVSVWFGAAHADTRSALEQSLPRLRELFASQGLSLADAGVFREPPRENFREQGYTSQGAGGVQGVSEIDLPRAAGRNGLLDAYA